MTDLNLFFSSKYKKIPSLQIPINYYHLGLSGFRKNGDLISTSFNPSFLLIDVSGTFGSTYFGTNDVVTLDVSNYSSYNNIPYCIYGATSSFVTTPSTDSIMPYEDDFGIYFRIKSTDGTHSRVYENSGFDKSPRPSGTYVFYTDTNGLYFGALCTDGVDRSVTFLNSTTGKNVLDGYWHDVLFLSDRDRNAYLFIDGDCVSEQSYVVTGTFQYSSTPYTYHIIGFHNNAVKNLSNYKIFKFGRSGLSIAGSKATNDLFIAISGTNSPVIYNQSIKDGLIPRLYRSPYSTVTQLGYPQIANANRAEALKDTGFDDVTKWNFYSSGGTGWSVYGSQAIGIGDAFFHSIIQKPVNRNELLEPNTYYIVEYEVVSSTLIGSDFRTEGGGTYTVWDKNYEGLPTTKGVHSLIVKTHQYCQTKDFTFALNGSGFASGYIAIDNVSVKRIGETISWGFNNTLLNSTSNSATLSASNTSFVTDYQVSPRVYNSINMQSGTISLWVKPNFEYNDGFTHRFLEVLDNGTSKLYIEKRSSSYIYFRIYLSTLIDKFYDASFMTKNTWHHLVLTWNINKIDSTKYVKCYVNNTLATSDTTKLGYMTGNTSDITIGNTDTVSDNVEADAEITNLIIDNVCWEDTKANAIAKGLSESQSVEYNYNSGVPKKPVCDAFTHSLMVVE